MTVELTISGRHVDVTDAMHDHVQQHMDRLPRFDDRIQHVTVTLARESGTDHVEIVAKMHRNVIVANAESHDVYASIDAAFGKLERSVARLHDKLVSKKAREAQKAAETERAPEQ